MTTAVVQPIAGVSATRETDIEVIYPSVASNFLGQIIGAIMGGVSSAIPILFLRLIVMVIFGAILIPLGLLAYVVRLLGSCYVLTNRSVYQRSILFGNRSTEVSLTEIQGVEVDTDGTGYKFHNVGDVHLLNAQGNVLLTIEATPYPARVAQIVEDARSARVRSDASLAAIKSRG